METGLYDMKLSQKGDLSTVESAVTVAPTVTVDWLHGDLSRTSNI